METIDLDDSSDSTDADWETLDQRFDIPQTPSTTSDEAPQNRSHTLPDSEAESSDNEPIARDRGDLVPRPKPGGYESRVEQILWENPSMTILITDAGKSAESGGKYIVYTIRTGVCGCAKDRSLDSWSTDCSIEPRSAQTILGIRVFA